MGYGDRLIAAEHIERLCKALDGVVAYLDGHAEFQAGARAIDGRPRRAEGSAMSETQRDIVTRLRDPMLYFGYGDRVIAAAEIERLRKVALAFDAQHRSRRPRRARGDP